MNADIVKNDFLYRPWETIRLNVRLWSAVQASNFADAVQAAAKRYPYLCVKVLRRGKHYTIGFNEKPVPVIFGRKPIVLGSEEANGHYLAVGYEGDRLFFDVYHNLCDTKGLVPFVQTVLYLYLKSTVNPALEKAKIRLPGEPFFENETEDPFASLELPEDIQPIFSWRFADSFVPDSRYSRSNHRYCYIVKVPSAEFERLFKTNDGSPVVLTSYFLKETIKRLFPEREGLPITFGIPHSLRKDLLGENNYHNQLVTLFLRYDERIDALPLMMQLTSARGSLILQMDHDNMLFHVKQNADFVREIDALIETEEKRAQCHKAIEPIIEHPETACISYAGNIRWGVLSAYMRELYIECTVLAAPLFIQISALNDAFWLCFQQRDETEVFAKTFVEMLRENGISAEMADNFRQEAFEGYMP